MLVPWTPLTPSRRERAVRRIGASLALSAGVALLLGAAREEAFDAALALAALFALLAGAGALRSVPAAPLEVGVEESGALLLRHGTAVDERPEQGVQCVFAAPWLITLRRGTMLVPIWPDSVPGNAYRRLWVHIRWGAGRAPAGLPAGSAPGQPE